MIQKTRFVAALCAFALTAGCATIVSDPTQTIPIASTPNGAAIKITDEVGTTVYEGQTPTTVTLNKSDGSYFGGKRYKVAISKEGYSPYELDVKATPSGWYIGGNILFGGLIGWLIVDPLNGDMYKLTTKEINATLTSKTANIGVGDSENRIVLLEEVPTELRALMVKLN